jgi:hypothetical protein
MVSIEVMAMRPASMAAVTFDCVSASAARASSP